MRRIAVLEEVTETLGLDPVARKLAVLLHSLWVSGEVYDPLYNTHRRQEREEAA